MSKIAGRKKRIIGTTAALVVVGGGAAFAYWTASGHGSDSAKSGTAANFSVTSEVVTDATLTPGGPAKTFKFTVKNEGTGVQQVTSVNAAVANADGSAWTAVPGCTAADFSVTPAASTAQSLAAGETLSETVTLQMINRTANQDACQGITTIPLYFTAN